MRLYNKGQRTIQYQDLNLRPGGFADFSGEDQKHADYLMKVFPDELENADKAAEKFEGKNDAATKFAKSSPAGVVDDTMHPLLQEQTEGTGGKVVKKADVGDDAAEGDEQPDGVFANAKAERYAAEQGIDVSTVTGTGRDGKITTADLKAAQG